MNIIDINDAPNLGKMVLVYSETGVGKSTSILQTVPLPALYISTEPRNPKISLRASGRTVKPGEIDLVQYSTWTELYELITNKTKIDMKKYTSVVLDSLSYLMNVRLSNEIEDEIFDSQDDKKKVVKTLISSTKMSLEGYGGLASQMIRLIKALGELAKKHGTNVIMTALVTEHPKWDRDLAAAPALKGNEFPSNLPGFLDLIGYAQTRIDKDGRKVFPPLVFFEAENDEYLCKFTGVRPNVDLVKIPLDLNIILGNNTKG